MFQIVLTGKEYNKLEGRFSIFVDKFDVKSHVN